jgi:hypothetical protein
MSDWSEFKRKASELSSIIREHSFHWLTWRILRFFGADCSFREVVARRYESQKASLPNLGYAKDGETLLKIAEDIRDESDKRRGVVIDKCKTLLTLSSFLLPLLLAVSTQTSWPVLFFIPASFVFATAYLVLNVLDVGADQQLSLDQAEVDLSKDDLNKRFVQSYLSTACTTTREPISSFK